MPFYIRGLSRIASVLVGIFIAFVVSSFFLSERAAARIPEKFGGVILLLGDLQTFIHDSYLVDNEFVAEEFKTVALDKAGKIQISLESLRVLAENAQEEIFLSELEGRCARDVIDWLTTTRRMYYLSVTMVYARIWDVDEGIHLEMERSLRTLIEVVDVSFKTLGQLLQQQSLSLNSPEDVTRALRSLREAVELSRKVFDDQQRHIHYEAERSYTHQDWANWNHYGMTFMQLLANLEHFIEVTSTVMAE
jgi:hypothetical protein